MTYTIISVIAFVIILNSLSFTIKLCLNVKDSEKYYEIVYRFDWVNGIGMAILTLIPSVVGIVMMHRLRNRFDDIYRDYGCKIQTILIIQVISIVIATFF